MNKKILLVLVGLTLLMANGTEIAWAQNVHTRSKKKTGAPVERRERLDGSGEFQYKRISKVKVAKLTSGLGLFASASYYSQAARVFRDGDGSPVDISAMTGFVPYFGILFDQPIGSAWSMRLSLQMRKLKLSGQAKVLTSNVPSAPSNREILQDFFGAGVDFRYHFGFSKALYLGGRTEVAQATKTTLVAANAEDRPEKPIYVLIQAMTGYGIIFKPLYLTPELRIGLIPNSSPMILNAELLLALGFQI